MNYLRHSKSTIRYVFIAIVVAVALFPIFWGITTSFKDKIDALANPPAWIFKPTLENFRYITYSKIAFPDYLLNSVIISFGTTLIAITAGSLAGYSLARFNIKNKENIAFWMLSTRMMPAPAVVLPLYILMRNLRLIDTHIAPMLVHSIITLPFAVWVMRGFFEEIPIAVEESAMMDGLSRFGVFLRITLPLSVPGLIVTALFCLMFSWNEFLFALVLTSTNAKPATVACTEFRGWMETAWGPASSAITITIIPILVISLLLQKHIVRGMTFGAVK